jgi:uncharacterized protein
MLRFAYVYFMKDEPEQVASAVPNHVRHWQRLELEHYQGGPFADRSGGLILFDAPRFEEAEGAVESDPFVVSDLLDAYWLKEWSPEQP